MDATDGFVRPVVSCPIAQFVGKGTREGQLCVSPLFRQLLLTHKIDITPIRETYLAQSLISTVRFCIHSGKGWDVAEVAMTVLLAIADSVDGSVILSSLQLDRSLCFPWNRSTIFHHTANTSTGWGFSCVL